MDITQADQMLVGVTQANQIIRCQCNFPRSTGTGKIVTSNALEEGPTGEPR